MNEGFIPRYTEPTIRAAKETFHDGKRIAGKALTTSPFDTITETALAAAALPVKAIGYTAARGVYDVLNLTGKAAWGLAKLPLKLAAKAPIFPIPKR